METLHAPQLRFAEALPAANEIKHFENDGMSDAELEQYARRTTKRPLLCFAAIAASLFAPELICRLLGVW